MIDKIVDEGKFLVALNKVSVAINTPGCKTATVKLDIPWQDAECVVNDLRRSGFKAYFLSFGHTTVSVSWP